ncbi:MAG: ribonuclease III family protein [Promethearchaeota archaeon]|nr:MAG: ribonuclease III family protein [Candidatus Lokiarchaeota archaeon]
MLKNENDKLKELQERLEYKFKNEDLLRNALTTPQLGKQLDILDYNALELLGDACIKLIFISKKIKEGLIDPGEITITKQCLENDETLSKISNDYFNLKKFVLKSENQVIEGTRILADVFEAICGAIFLDSDSNLNLVEEKVINRFYDDWDVIINETILNKSKLLEYIQKRHRITPVIKTDFLNKGSDHAPKWIAKNPKILDRNNKILIPLKKDIKSEECKSKKEAEQDLYLKILKYLKKK